ncbi:tyrosine-type recombinase/integrase [Neobacillus rhizophilus]|uniref:Tyrosine-type recombinase/integrase n=1 Tax=Neobacillus rhizophilus TaxID=2833579 RepID=A0A942U5V2_9BACI|nr:tyrosine-type recombinase/integrase [Neobacillus rhizophilus]MBS4213233.1 tyrosine-type recombinase/integrase [Neobacillus rhizophilus]
MSRRKSVSTNILEKLVQQQEQPSKDFQKATEEFLKHCKIKGLSPDTVKFYDKELKGLSRALVEIEISLKDLRILKTNDIESWIEYMLEKKRAISSINARMRAGRTFMNYCLKKDYIERNPFDGVSQLKKRHTVGATFTKKQLNKLLDAPDITQFVGLRDLAIMLTFAHVGLRLKELCSLKVQDISFEGNGEVIIQQAKNRYARRVPMTKRLRTVLKAYVAERGLLEETDALFVSVENAPINARTVQERLKHYGVVSKVENEVPVSPHAFRRTFCRLKVEAGVNLFVLQRLTGHSDLEMLQRYVQIYGKDLEQAIEKGFE